MARKKAVLWAGDCETDPFKYGREPKPFAWGATSELGERVSFWGDDATDKFGAWLLSLDNGLLVMHNGGKFDALFLKKFIRGNILLVDGRIIKCKIGNVEVRDSFAILPMPLSKMHTTSGEKYEIDYAKLERDVREKHRREIMRYLMQDCEVLLAAVADFYNRSGKRRLTIASQASHELREYYPDLPKLGEQHYKEFSPFYYGGRVQAFEKGILRGKFKLFDVNSMYPDAMKRKHHPFGRSYRVAPFSIKNLPDNDCGFFEGRCESLGAFPVRDAKNKNTPYSFGAVDIKVTLHEVRAALENNLANNFEGKLIIPNNTTTFEKFIDHHYSARLVAKANKDGGGDIYHKLVQNSSYGRFAMSPEGRDDTYYAEHGEDISELLREGWRIHPHIDLDDERFILKRAPLRPWQFYEDVATGASITGAARAKLMDAIAKSKRVIYCDTDSILCEEFGGEIDDKKLGAWKFEGEFDCAAIAGKKMYALYKNGECTKQASKGVRATPEQIYAAASGEVVNVKNDAPTLRIHKKSFMTRDIKIT